MKKKKRIVICGAGLAGLCLARQLSLHSHDLEITLFDKQKGPLSLAAHKVGESSVEVGAHYFAEKLKLKDYLLENHLLKLGLRFFFGDPRGPFEERPEVGLSRFPGQNSYQLDRGLMENDLRAMVKEMGIDFYEGLALKDITLNPEGHHRITAQWADTQEEKIFDADWVIDATGRCRFLQKKLGLHKELDGCHSSVWFRVPGKISVNDFVPADHPWQKRVADDRYHSTNHLMGQGYWVWLIPLSTGHTSIGIVYDENFHRSRDMLNHKKANDWLKTFEPRLAEALEDVDILDFIFLKGYTHGSTKVYSEDRWACVGEAGVFADPFYSPGSDLIALANTITTEMIAKDVAGQHSASEIAQFNWFYLGLHEGLTASIQSGYPFFGKEVAMSAKLLWDFSLSWNVFCPMVFNGTYIANAMHNELALAIQKIFKLNKKVQSFFAQWAEKETGNLSYSFIDYLSQPSLKEIYSRNLISNKSIEELMVDSEKNLQYFEELAMSYFLLAVEDLYPEKLELFQNPWINPMALDLNCENWEKNGLFNAKSPERDFSSLREEVRRRYTFHTRCKKNIISPS